MAAHASGNKKNNEKTKTTLAKMLEIHTTTHTYMAYAPTATPHAYNLARYDSPLPTTTHLIRLVQEQQQEE